MGMRWRGLSLALVAAVAALLSAPYPGAKPGSAAELVLLVTSIGDPATGTACPDATKCTLRKALETINADATATGYRLTFEPAAFPVGTPATIEVLGSRLPAVTRPDVLIDASAAGVIVDGNKLQAGSDGLVLSGERATVRGLRIRRFAGACLSVIGRASTIGGDLTNGTGNRLGDCGVGLIVGGAGSTVRGNVVGFAPTNEDAAPVTTGILVKAADVVVGGEAAGPNQANIIGNAQNGIRVGEGAEPGFTGVIVARNIIGRGAAGAAALVARGLVLAPPSNGTRAIENTFANATTGIEVLGGSTGPLSSGNALRDNRFGAVGGLAIDLRANGLRDPNDPGDADTGANDGLNHPLWTRTVQAAISGTTCSRCTVDIYRAQHFSGGARDYGTQRFASVTADEAGSFTLNAPPVLPGDWVVAVAVDAAGNTSEFGPSSRVGGGALQCGNQRLLAGWNHTGYFGPAAALGDVFPGDSQRLIRAVYQLEDGGASFRHWFRDTPVGRTLTSLDPGEAYWFLADGPLTLTAGFTLTAPVAVPLKPGWNDFVYFGANADTLDALGAAVDVLDELHHFRNDERGGGEWLSWGSVPTPGWARDFTAIEGCGVYLVKAAAQGTVFPPQP